MALLAAAAVGQGPLDSRYSGDGKLVLDFTDPEVREMCRDWRGCPDIANAGAVGAEGKLTVAGHVLRPGTGVDFAVVRRNPGGAPDRDFAGDGLQTIDFEGRRDVANDLELTRNGKIVVAGVTRRPGGFAMAVTRLKSYGALDRSFSGDGRAVIPFGLANAYAHTVLSLPDGGLIVAGCSYPYIVILRFDRRGNLVEGFGAGGIKRIRSDRNYGACINESALQRDGKVVLVGDGRVPGERREDGGMDFLAIRLLANGRLDHSFGGDGVRMVGFGGYSYDYGWDVAIQRSGEIVIGGNTAPQGGSTGRVVVHLALARLTPAGRLDRSFSRDGRKVVRFNRPREYQCAPQGTGYGRCSEYGAGVDLLGRGGIVIAGRQHRKGAKLDVAVVRLRRDGSPDRSFSGDGRMLFGFGSPREDMANDVVVSGRVFYAIGHTRRPATGTDMAIARLRR
jgi:uncharacterized delta-60 repeat protein